MSTVTGKHEFLIHRLREWTLLRAIAMDAPWRPEEVVAASD